MQQRGFTLIELIIVIVILGILAVTAAPRFIDLSDEARMATMRGVLGAMKSANQISHAQLLITPTGNVAIEEVEIQADAAPLGDFDDPGADVGSAFGYVHAEDMCELVGLALDDDTPGTFGGDDPTDTLTCASTATVATVTDDEAPNPDLCFITYTEPAADGDAPTFAFEDGGCE